MPGLFARRVDQQIAYAHALLAMLDTAPSEFTRRALVQSAYLQLELAVAFYLAEITRRYRLNNTADESSLIDAGQLVELFERCVHTAEVQELQNLQHDNNSWWSIFLLQRSAIHCGEKRPALKGSLFQTHEGEEDAASFPRIGAVDVDAGTRNPSAADALWFVSSLRAMVERQRAADEEY